jgi:hypothetical protein
MSTLKWMTGLVPLAVLAIAPAALGEEATAPASEVGVQAPVPPTQASKEDPQARRIRELEAEVQRLRAEVAARSSDGPRYLEQTDELRP